MARKDADCISQSCNTTSHLCAAGMNQHCDETIKCGATGSVGYSVELKVRPELRSLCGVTSWNGRRHPSRSPQS